MVQGASGEVSLDGAFRRSPPGIQDAIRGSEFGVCAAAVTTHVQLIHGAQGIRTLTIVLIAPKRE